jgi:hypothetical protein
MLFIVEVSFNNLQEISTICWSDYDDDDMMQMQNHKRVKCVRYEKFQF